MARSPTVLCVVVALASSAASRAHAETCPGPADAPLLSSIDSEARLDFLAHAFDREVHDIDAWSWTWGSIYTAGAIAQGVALSVTSDRGARTDLTVGVISTSVGAASLLGLPLKLTLPLRAARRDWGGPDRCALLANAERTLASVASDQALANGILAHVGNVAVNAGIALILGLGYGRWQSAAISGGAGVAIGEANAFSQPHHLRDVQARYRAGQLGGLTAEAAGQGTAWWIVPVISRQHAGVALVLAW